MYYLISLIQYPLDVERATPSDPIHVIPTICLLGKWSHTSCPGKTCLIIPLGTLVMN